MDEEEVEYKDVGLDFGDLGVIIGGGTAEDVAEDLDYNFLMNRPMINGVILENNKTFEDLGLNEVSNLELLDLYNATVRS